VTGFQELGFNFKQCRYAPLLVLIPELNPRVHRHVTTTVACKGSVSKDVDIKKSSINRQHRVQQQENVSRIQRTQTRDSHAQLNLVRGATSFEIVSVSCVLHDQTQKLDI
jgi:hypothetical protein